MDRFVKVQDILFKHDPLSLRDKSEYEVEARLLSRRLPFNSLGEAKRTVHDILDNHLDFPRNFTCDKVAKELFEL